MNATLRVILLPLIVFVLAPAAFAEDSKEVRGRVVDADGKPVPGIGIATGWQFHGPAPSARWRAGVKTYSHAATTTDPEGKFARALYFRGRPVALLALDLASKRGGVFVLDKRNVDQEQTLTVRPLVHLHGSIGIGDANLRDTTVYVYVFDPRAPIAFASYITRDRFSFHLPPGTYQVLFTAKDLVPLKVPVGLAAGNREVDLRTVDLSATNLAQHYGKEPPPWNVTAARGVDPGVRLSDYKGKWVLIEFWAYW
ncbi:MAG: TlpA family protein disulfide reductase [Planctomycetota bacterium]|jgi:hypothetical protein